MLDLASANQAGFLVASQRSTSQVLLSVATYCDVAGGVAQNFRKIPLKKLIDVIDWDSIVSAYRGGSVTDYEPESNGVILGLEHEN